MSKRNRGTRRSSGRPAQRPATARAARPATRTTADARPRAEAAPPSQLLAAEEIAEELVDDRPEEAVKDLKRVARSTPARSRAKPSSLLAAKAATEYVYVVQDVMRIAAVATLLFGTMLLLWLLIVVLRVVTI